MIKNVFLPDKIKNYYVFAQRILGVDIAQTHVNLSVVLAKGNTLHVQKHVEQTLQAGTPADRNERVIEGLKQALNSVGTFDLVRSVLPSSLVVLKKLTLPFTSRDKIAMVIGFEVEPLLPFNMQETVLDFIITDINEEEKSSQILVAATQKQTIANHLELLAQAGLNPDTITIDLFALYDVFTHIDQYQNLEGSCALINLGVQTTSIACMQSDKLTFIRTVPYGLSHMAKQISEKLQIPANQAVENIIRFGTQKEGSEEYTQVTTHALNEFWNKIRFTLDSFAQQSNDPIKHLFVLGDGANVKSLIDSAESIIGIPAQLFDATLLATHERISLDTKEPIASTGIVSVAAALPLAHTGMFNLRQQEFASTDTVSTLRMLIVAGVLALALLGGLIGYSVVQKRKLSAELYESEQEVITALKKRFKAIDKDEDDYEAVVDEAQRELKKELDTLFKFSQRARTSFLQSLFELTNRIDQESLGFDMERLTITETDLILKARVRDHDALKVLERELRESELFSYIQPQNDPSFTMRITLARPMEGQ